MENIFLQGEIIWEWEDLWMSFKDAKYYHDRRVHPSEIDEDSYYTVPITHVKGVRKKYPKGTLARIGIKKSTWNYVIQSILIPK